MSPGNAFEGRFPSSLLKHEILSPRPASISLGVQVEAKKMILGCRATQKVPIG